MRLFMRRPVFKVQLHRVDRDGNVLGSWQPYLVRGRARAQREANALRSDNRWGGHGMWPRVTVEEVPR